MLAPLVQQRDGSWALVGFRNRIIVLFNWAYSYFTYDRGVRLISWIAVGFISYAFVAAYVSIALAPAGFWVEANRGLGVDEVLELNLPGLAGRLPDRIAAKQHAPSGYQRQQAEQQNEEIAEHHGDRDHLHEPQE